MKHWIDTLPWPVLREILRLMRVDRPIGTWLVLWPALWSVFASVKPELPNWPVVVIFALGSFIMRSAGCVINDLADKDFDPLVARTKDRPLASRRLSVTVAKWVLFVLLSIALLLALTLNAFAIELSVVGAFLAISYPFTKRFVHWPQFYLGAAFGWGVIVAWGAQTGELSGVAWLLFLATLTWAAAYDTLYALMDIEDDLKIGVRSTAILFGRWALAMVALLYALTLLFLVAAGIVLSLSITYYLVMVLVMLHMLWQIRVSSRQEYLRAFLSNKWLGALIFLGILLG
ncbi:MAG: 4-hydroxybenzoate octaprenyltransferase [Magnetococcales bacterium]|nr:4-hydroxybenzoate octaprenyltransferase [Magnetococcales bacterium]MBF0114817.1 4-hydroxybenzoate octaprenyltransferase [Magnetococcales bacterium]